MKNHGGRDESATIAQIESEAKIAKAANYEDVDKEYMVVNIKEEESLPHYPKRLTKKFEEESQ